MITFKITKLPNRPDREVVELRNNGKLIGHIMSSIDTPDLPGSEGYCALQIYSPHIRAITQAEYTDGAVTDILGVMIGFDENKITEQGSDDGSNSRH